MNIFFVHPNSQICAYQLCDKHVVKMITESVQVLCTVCIEQNLAMGLPYKSTHKQHPITLWAGKSLENYQWLWQHAYFLGIEYNQRYGKSHKSFQALVDSVPYTVLLPKTGLHQHPNCTPYKDLPVLDAYRRFYKIDKSRFAKWKLGNVPDWYQSRVDY